MLFLIFLIALCFFLYHLRYDDALLSLKSAARSIKIFFFRSFFALIPLFLVIFYFNLKITSINNYKLHFFRGLVGIAAMSLFFISLRYVPLIEMQTISYSSVFFISILSIFFLG